MPNRSNAEIREMMKNASIPRTVHHHTLPSLGFDNIRSMINDGSMRPVDDDGESLGYSGLNLYSLQPERYHECRIVAQVMAKEFILKGWEKVGVFSLVRIIKSVKFDEFDDYRALFMGLHQVVVTDFFRDGHEAPMSGYERQTVQDTLLRLAEMGVGVTLVGDSRLTKWEAWWDQSFVKQWEAINITVET